MKQPACKANLSIFSWKFCFRLVRANLSFLSTFRKCIQQVFIFKTVLTSFNTDCCYRKVRLEVEILGEIREWRGERDCLFSVHNKNSLALISFMSAAGTHVKLVVLVLVGRNRMNLLWLWCSVFTAAALSLIRPALPHHPNHSAINIV